MDLLYAVPQKPHLSACVPQDSPESADSGLHSFSCGPLVGDPLPSHIPKASGFRYSRGKCVGNWDQLEFPGNSRTSAQRLFTHPEWAFSKEPKEELCLASGKWVSGGFSRFFSHWWTSTSPITASISCHPLWSRWAAAGTPPIRRKRWWPGESTKEKGGRSAGVIYTEPQIPMDKTVSLVENWTV